MSLAVSLQATYHRNICGQFRFLSENCLAGWYYRVLQGGETSMGDTPSLIDRNADPVTLREFWTTWLSRNPDAAQLESLLETPGLAAGWVTYLNARLEKLGAGTAAAISSWHARKDV